MDWNRTKNRLISRVITRFPLLATPFIRSYKPCETEDIPWAPFAKPLAQCKAAIVTTAGVHHRDQPAFTMSDRDGDPSFRTIDLCRPLDTLMITHDYYDHVDADKDMNIVFPADRLREFAVEGLIGKLSVKAYSFMGHITGPHLTTLLRVSGPEVARALKEDQVDAVLLIPG